jgi:dolichyl-phosphate-mannose--protein O-mannosyl transferase
VREYLKVNKCDGVPPSRYDYAAANKALGNYIIYRHTLHQQQLNHTCKQKYKQKQQQQQQQQQQRNNNNNNHLLGPVPRRGWHRPTAQP